MVGSWAPVVTLQKKHNIPLENYHTVAQEHNRVRGSNIKYSDRLTEFHWSEINISQTEHAREFETISESPHPNILL